MRKVIGICNCGVYKVPWYLKVLHTLRGIHLDKLYNISWYRKVHEAWEGIHFDKEFPTIGMFHIGVFIREVPLRNWIQFKLTGRRGSYVSYCDYRSYREKPLNYLAFIAKRCTKCKNLALKCPRT